MPGSMIAICAVEPPGSVCVWRDDFCRAASPGDTRKLDIVSVFEAVGRGARKTKKISDDEIAGD